MTALVLSLFLAGLLCSAMAAAARDAFRQTVDLGWTAHDDLVLQRLLGSGIETPG